jgi:L-alanine-DL-glutamate epimerase-like enolase superfamily enzyme
MRITDLTILRADGGGRTFDFLKLTTDEGLVGWSEFHEYFGGVGVGAVIEGLRPLVIGTDPARHRMTALRLRAARRAASGGMADQAIAAIENALLDLHAKSLDVPVYDLFGGPVRDDIETYFSHCGLYRVRWHEEMQLPRLTTLADLKDAAADAAARGFDALKANVVLFDEDPVTVHVAGFGGPGDFPSLTASPRLIASIREQMIALREGAGGDVGVALDLNFNFRVDGHRKIARALNDLGLVWLELDGLTPTEFRSLREIATMPIASGETLYGRRQLMPFLEAAAFDIMIIDVPMNGLSESLRMAEASEAYDVSVAPHNFYGPLANLITAHFCALVPNLSVMEIDGDTVPWYDDLLTSPTTVSGGRFPLPTGPGWGADVDEEAVRAHPPRS